MDLSDENREAARLRAYKIWEEKGYPDGDHESHWIQALTELGLNAPNNSAPDDAPDQSS